MDFKGYAFFSPHEKDVTSGAWESCQSTKVGGAQEGAQLWTFATETVRTVALANLTATSGDKSAAERSCFIHSEWREAGLGGVRVEFKGEL